MKDQIIKCLARDGRVRIYICDTTNLVQEAKERHDLWPTASAALGRTLSVAVMMGANLKSEKEKLTITVNGGGPIGTIMVDAYSNGQVRGFVGEPHVHYQYNDTNKLAVGVAVGKEGYLEVRKSMSLKEDFNGRVALQSGEIGDDFAYYFALSEQTPSIVSVGVLVESDNSIIHSGGLLIQMMPDATEEDIVATEEIVQQLKPMTTLMQEGKTLEDILHSLYEDVKILERVPCSFACGCSEEKMRAAISTLADTEIQAMIEEDKGCDIHCQFCSNAYHFDEGALEKIIEDKHANVEN